MENKVKITGLDCPNCARKLEETLNKNKELNNVRVNFTTKKNCYNTIAIKFPDPRFTILVKVC